MAAACSMILDKKMWLHVRRMDVLLPFLHTLKRCQAEGGTCARLRDFMASVELRYRVKGRMTDG